ncbi:hypothetical protein B0H13DRAFT_2422881 [Mycena leptocephala]|nr:hypothetical protein B0H13DRAFT_2422881 [Mycena leptocephala]
MPMMTSAADRFQNASRSVWLSSSYESFTALDHIWRAATSEEQRLVLLKKLSKEESRNIVERISPLPATWTCEGFTLAVVDAASTSSTQTAYYQTSSSTTHSFAVVEEASWTGLVDSSLKECVTVPTAPTAIYIMSIPPALHPTATLIAPTLPQSNTPVVAFPPTKTPLYAGKNESSFGETITVKKEALLLQPLLAACGQHQFVLLLRTSTGPQLTFGGRIVLNLVRRILSVEIFGDAYSKETFALGKDDCAEGEHKVMFDEINASFERLSAVNPRPLTGIRGLLVPPHDCLTIAMDQALCHLGPGGQAALAMSSVPANIMLFASFPAPRPLHRDDSIALAGPSVPARKSRWG